MNVNRVGCGSLRLFKSSFQKNGMASCSQQDWRMFLKPPSQSDTLHQFSPFSQLCSAVPFLKRGLTFRAVSF